MSFSENNLAAATSPYLRQHASNPVWWQEWRPDVLEYARQRNKPLLVSVGYSTCHWCHVMASDAFSNTDVAAYLNAHFVSIKVDREERPDIDHYMMSFLVATTGSGGWPLNVFLTPDQRPFFAMTYAATEPRFNVPAFGDILARVVEFHDENGQKVEEFALNEDHSTTLPVTAKSLASLVTSGASEQPTDETPVAIIGEDDDAQVAASISELHDSFDTHYGGFGSSQKFPPHSVLLYLIHAASAGFTDPASEIVRSTLNAMMTRGLHDHLQGGFFRYAVDRDWTIPHFEKMLYDQALTLWTFSLAARLFDHEGYRQTAGGVFRALEETFRAGSGYASAHDADTDHDEGATYLWQKDQVERILDEEEIDAFLRVFSVSDDGNFEGRNHLIRSLPPGYERDARSKHAPDRAVLERAMQKLLDERNRRAQPSRDDKVILEWNALAGCGLLAAHRFARVEGTLARAKELAEYLVETLTGPESVYHLVLDGSVQEQEFLADAAALLLFLDMLAEESEELDARFAQTRAMLVRRIGSFSRSGHWFQSAADDFHPVPADPFDQPTPSGPAIADYALLHAQLRTHGEYEPRPFTDAHARAFANLSTLASRGYTYVVESPEEIAWTDMPVNSVRVRGQARTSCYRGVCYLGVPPKKNPGQR